MSMATNAQLATEFDNTATGTLWPRIRMKYANTKSTGDEDECNEIRSAGESHQPNGYAMNRKDQFPNAKY